MKFSSATLTTALVAIVVASPVAEKSNIEVALDFVPVIPSVESGEIITASGVDKKRSVGLAKRQLVVDIWEHPNKGGRHEGLISEEQRCYNLGNGWNDLVSSLYVPGGKGCTFYQNNGCGPGDVRVTVGSDTYVSDLASVVYNGRNFDNFISSYLCWQN